MTTRRLFPRTHVPPVTYRPRRGGLDRKPRGERDAVPAPRRVPCPARGRAGAQPRWKDESHARHALEAAPDKGFSLAIPAIRMDSGPQPCLPVDRHSMRFSTMPSFARASRPRLEPLQAHEGRIGRSTHIPANAGIPSPSEGEGQGGGAVAVCVPARASHPHPGLPPGRGKERGASSRAVGCHRAVLPCEQEGASAAAAEVVGSHQPAIVCPACPGNPTG